MKQAAAICQHCGHKLAKRTTPTVHAVETASLSTEQVYKHYKATAPIEDLRFFMRVAQCSESLRVDLDSLMASAFAGERLTMNRAAFYRRFRDLQIVWGTVRLANERAEAQAAIYARDAELDAAAA